jgi:NAD(P)-dependent dehydrogenase (short-subunit alcohol dehydrogenase family)
MAAINFDGRAAVVTGAGGGLGKTYALELARRGASVVVNDLGGSVDGSGGGNSMADAVGVDAVINNAGVLRDKSFTKLTPQELEIVLDVHLKGAFYVSQPAFRVMKENGFGRFVFTSSAAGLLGNFGQTNYGAAKMGLVGLAHVLAQEGAKYNIKANAIAPIARTRMTESLLGPLADALDPECVTPLVVYLVSEACEHTHEIFSVGGGRYARMFIGMTPGWYAGKAAKPSAEDVLANMEAIRNTDEYSIPDGVGDEFKLLLKMLKS